MTIKVRFFARFRELLGTDIIADLTGSPTLLSLVRDIAVKNREGYDAIFDGQGRFHEFVIVMRNGKRIEHAEAAAVRLNDGDEVAVFPPVAGG